MSQSVTSASLISSLDPRYGFLSCYALQYLNHPIESNVGSSREAIKVDLASKIVYDDPSVFRRLRVHGVDDDVVAKCASTLNFLYVSDISLIKELAEQALKKSHDTLGVEETSDKRSNNNKEEKSGNQESVEEKRMYDPLVCDALHDLYRSFSLTILIYRSACSIT